MNLKKILILPVGFILIHVLYIGCCKCLEGNFHREISSLIVFENSHSNLDTRDTVKVIDTLFSTIQVNFNLVAKNRVNPMAQFVNAAYATSCNCSNYSDSGFRYKIDSLVISSNDVFKGIPAGQNIGIHFTGVYSNYNNGTYSISYLTIPQLVDSLNAHRNYNQFSLFTNPGAMPVKIHRLKYLLYSNGKTYESTGAKWVIWQ